MITPTPESLELDLDYLVELTARLARVPTHVPLGYETRMAPDDPKLVHYVQSVLRPELAGIGCELIDAPPNNIIVRAGTGQTSGSLLLVNYTPEHHHNLMEEPFSGKVAPAVEHGTPEPSVFGQGVSSGKAHQGVMLTVLRALAQSGRELAGRLYWAVSNEGSSSHACAASILAALPERPSFCILQFPTGLEIVLGNRGRVDVDVHVKGRVTHSSTPAAGLSAIDGANEVVNRLKALHWPDRHPLLGERHALVYKIQYEPLAPHTLPEHAYLTVDRRMLPGDDPDEATAEMEAAIGDLSPYEVTVTRGVYMLPSLVDPSEPGVRALAAAHHAITGESAPTTYLAGTFDAGAWCRAGIPTVMYGTGGGVWPIGADFVPLSGLRTEVEVLAQLILAELG